MPVAPARKDGPAFYVVPPLLLAAVFVFCAHVPGPGSLFSSETDVAVAPPATDAAAPGAAPVDAAAPAATATEGQKSAGAGMGVAMTPSAPADVNDDLPEFAIPEGMESVAEGAELVSVSASREGMPPDNAVDGSCENDGYVAVALPGADGSSAWWQLDAPQNSSFSANTVVVYGGGSASPAGKLVGGFRVDVTLEDGTVVSRNFCEPGFALEGYEALPLGGDKRVRRVRVTSLRTGTPVVLREVQLIGQAPPEGGE